MKRFLLLIMLLLCMSFNAVKAEALYQNDKCRFTFVVPDDCKVIEEKSDNKSAAYSVYDTKNRTFVAYITYNNTYEKDKMQDYRKMRKHILKDNDSITIIDEKPFYNLLRQDLQYVYVSEGKEIFSKILLKASSFIHITAFYPLSEEAQQILDSFDNQPTFRGNLARVQQNAGSIAMCIYLTLLCLVGYRARNKETRWQYIILSLVLFTLPVVCIWQDTQVMLFVLGVLLCMWLFFFSHNKLLIWIIDSIF